jgi:hypothetical protein
MFKIYKTIIFIIFITLPLSSYSHTNHYDDLKRIEFDIYRNTKNIGKHIFSFEKNGEMLSVRSEIKFKIKKLGVVLYKYHVVGTEIYKDGNLVKFNSKTDANGKEKFVNLVYKDKEFLIDGSSFQGKVSTDFMLGTWWNHSIVKTNAQISAVSGRIIKQKVTFIGKDTIKVNGKNYEALHFNFSSTDEKLSKDKRLNTDIWYDSETLNWIKASFNKKGSWEYVLISIK